MAYRSERFDAGELLGLMQAWQAIDSLEESGIQIRTEVMAGGSYRRPLEPIIRKSLGDPNYLLQAVLCIPPASDTRRISARNFVEFSKDTLSRLSLPGDALIDDGGLNGLDPETKSFAFGSTGRTETDVLQIYPPWVKSRWEEAGRTCILMCGIEPPKPRAVLEDYPVEWDERLMRHGHVVFEPTPGGLATY